jgi:hypothetical protein
MRDAKLEKKNQRLMVGGTVRSGRNWLEDDRYSSAAIRLCSIYGSIDFRTFYLPIKAIKEPFRSSIKI